MAFPKKAPDEIKLLTFKFDSEMPEGVTLSNATVTATVVSGADDADDLDIGTIDIVDAEDDDGVAITGRESQWITVLIGDGVEGAKYRISAEADASNGEHNRIDCDLPVGVAGALV